MTLKETLETIKEYLKTNKDLSQLLTGDGSFINCYNKTTHRLHGKVDTLGATTYRMTHNSPNLTQLSKDQEFRELLTVPEDKLLVSSDAGALELVMMGHYLGEFDDYLFAKAVDSGDKSKGTDIHTINQKKAGLPTRDAAKTLIYATIYGAGATKIGLMLWDKDTKLDYSENEFKSEYDKLSNQIIYINNKPYFPADKGSVMPFDDSLVIKSLYGQKVLSSFRDNTLGYNELVFKMTALADQDKLYGLDGRKLYPRASYKALNLMLQSAGAIYMKHLLVLVDKRLRQNWTLNKEFSYVANIHDDLEFEIIPEIKDEFCQIIEQSFIDTSYNLGLKYPVYGEPSVGKTQWEVH